AGVCGASPNDGGTGIAAGDSGASPMISSEDGIVCASVHSPTTLPVSIAAADHAASGVDGTLVVTVSISVSHPSGVRATAGPAPGSTSSSSQEGVVPASVTSTASVVAGVAGVPGSAAVTSLSPVISSASTWSSISLPNDAASDGEAKAVGSIAPR